MVALVPWKTLWQDTKGDAVVEATILFPIMIMIFAGMVLLSMYLPTRSALQRATQTACNAIATQQGDTWLTYQDETLSYEWETQKENLDNVYVTMLNSFCAGTDPDYAETLVTKLEQQSLFLPAGTLTVDYRVVNYVVYKEIIITATREIKPPVDLSFVGFPKTIPITVTSTAVVQNGDEFVRNLDLAVDFIDYIDQKYQISSSELFQTVKEISQKFTSFLAI